MLGSRWSLVLVAFSALGASGCQSQAIEDRANAKLAEARASYEGAAIYPTCHDGATISGNCGLILKHASAQRFRTLFRDKKCLEKSDDECEALYQKMLDASLVQRYTLANWDAVALSCDKNPGRCDDPVKYELLLVDSHNLRVRDEAAQTENGIEAERRDLQGAHAARVLGAVVVAAAVADVATSARTTRPRRTYR